MFLQETPSSSTYGRYIGSPRTDSIQSDSILSGSPPCPMTMLPLPRATLPWMYIILSRGIPYLLSRMSV